MIVATVAIVVMASFFVIFGVFRLADGKGCDGHCAGCVDECRTDIEGGVP